MEEPVYVESIENSDKGSPPPAGSLTIYQTPPRQTRPVSEPTGPLPSPSSPENIYLKVRVVNNERTVYVVSPHGEIKHQGLQDVLEFEFEASKNRYIKPRKAGVQVLCGYEKTPGDILTIEFVEYKFVYLFRIVNGVMQWYFSYLGNLDDTFTHLERVRGLVRQHDFYKNLLLYTDSRNMRVLQAMLEYTGKKGEVCPRWIESEEGPHRHVVVKICTDMAVVDAVEAKSDLSYNTTHYMCWDTMCTELHKTLCDLESGAMFVLEMQGTDDFHKIPYSKGMQVRFPLTIMEQMNEVGGEQPLWMVPTVRPKCDEDGDEVLLDEDFEHDPLFFDGRLYPEDNFLGFGRWYRQEFLA